MHSDSQEQNQELVARSQQLFAEAEELYVRALVVEPNCVEALAQSAQLKVGSPSCSHSLVSPFPC